MKYCIYGIESFTYHTQKFNILRPDLEAKVKAAHRRGQGQGQGSSRPRPQNFVLELSSRSRPVLEDPIPVIQALFVNFFCIFLMFIYVQNIQDHSRDFSDVLSNTYTFWDNSGASFSIISLCMCNRFR